MARVAPTTAVVVLILAEVALFAFGDSLAAGTRGTVQTAIVVVAAPVVAGLLAWLASAGSNRR